MNAAELVVLLVLCAIALGAAAYGLWSDDLTEDQLRAVSEGGQGLPPP